MFFMCAHVYDMALCGNTVRMWLLVSFWLATPAIARHILLNEWPLHKKHRDCGHNQDIIKMLNRLTLECIGSKIRFTAK